MAYYNYITYPYKKREKSPSILSNYSTWKSGNSVYTILKYAFERMSCLISKPYFTETPNRLTIQLFYYTKKWEDNPKNLLISSDNYQDINSYWTTFQKQALTPPHGDSNKGGSVKGLPDFINATFKVIKNTNAVIDTFKNSRGNTTFLIKNQNKFKILILLLSKLFNKQVVLELTRIKRPYYDVTVLTQLFHKNSQSRKSRFIKLITLLLYTLSRKYHWASAALQNKTKITQLKSHDALRGFKIKLGGRLLSQKIIPRISSKTYNRGKLARGKVHFVNTSRISSKHKRGAYSITITTSSVIL
jgi:hypothetical protein